MTPTRLLNHIVVMLGDPNSTIAQINSTLNDYKTAANAAKEYDIKYYCERLEARIVALQAGAWTLPELKTQLSGQLSSIIARTEA